MGGNRIGLVAFDLDGTLLQGATVCEVIALRLGHLNRLKELESATTTEDAKSAREEMTTWYQSSNLQELCSYLEPIELAPGVIEGFKLLKLHHIRTAIISITWEFAVAYFAHRLGADYFVGTQLKPSGQILHFWPDDKPVWLANLANQLGINLQNVAAVGDSDGDLPMLKEVGYPFFVGKRKLKETEGVIYMPDANIYSITCQIVEAEI